VTATDRPNVITFGPGIPGDDELRLCGDIDGRRVLELGVSDGHNALAMAAGGAKVITVDPSAERITAVRQMLAEHDLRIECHQAELADLGFATSGSVELVVADRTLDDAGDLGRVLRQVHRVLRGGQHFVISVPHPFARIVDDALGGGRPDPYGRHERTIADWLTALARANFLVDGVHELGGDIAPAYLVLRARKEGT